MRLIFLLFFISSSAEALFPRLPPGTGKMAMGAGRLGVRLATEGYVDIPGACSKSCDFSQNPDYKTSKNECSAGISTPNENPCLTFTQFQMDYAGCVSSCSLRLGTEKYSCESNNGVFIITNGGDGVCEQSLACPSGTSLFDATSCKCDSNNYVFSPENYDSARCIDYDLHSGCGDEPAAFDSQEVKDAFTACVELENQTQANQEAADQAALEQAETNLAHNIEASAEGHRSSCSSQYQTFNSSCSQVSASMPDTASAQSKDAPTKEQCEALKSTSESIIQQNINQVQECMNRFQTLSSSCPLNTDTVSGVGNATVGAGTPAVATASVTRTGSGIIAENGETIQTAQAISAELNSKLSQLNSSLDATKREAENCVQALNDNVEPDHTTPGGGPPPNPVGRLAQIGNTLGQFKTGGRGELGDGSHGFSSGGGQIGGFGRGSSHSYSGSGDSYQGGSFNNFKSAGSNTNSLTGGDHQSYDDSADARKANFNLNNSGGAAASPSYNASSGGGRLGGGFSGSGGSNNNAPSRRRRSYRTAKQRNLIEGFKSLKTSGGGANVAIKPGDYKRLGRATLRKRLAAARKKHGKSMPLIFKNGKFVLDFLAMKESELFKSKNAAMERYWNGSSDGGRLPTSIKDLPVHQNAKLVIWPLLNYRYRKELGAGN